MAKLDQNRVNDIADKIRAACSPVIGADMDRADADELLKSAKDKAINAREAIMVTLAALAEAGGWTDHEIRAAAGLAANKSNNATDKALATFIGETKRAMHPDVRVHVPILVALRDTVWDGETLAREIDKGADTPCRKAFQRKYHMMTALFGEAENGNLMLTGDAVTTFAEARDPDMDPAKVFKRIEDMQTKLMAIFRNFPTNAIQATLQEMAEITEADMKGIRPAQAQARAARVVLPPVTAPVAARAAAPRAVHNAGEPADGAIDLDDAMEALNMAA